MNCLIYVFVYFLRGSSDLRIFYSDGDVTITGESCKGLPHLLSACNNHLQRSMTLTPIADRLAVELSIPVLTT